MATLQLWGKIVQRKETIQQKLIVQTTLHKKDTQIRTSQVDRNNVRKQETQDILQCMNSEIIFRRLQMNRSKGSKRDIEQLVDP